MSVKQVALNDDERLTLIRMVKAAISKSVRRRAKVPFVPEYGKRDTELFKQQRLNALLEKLVDAPDGRPLWKREMDYG